MDPFVVFPILFVVIFVLAITSVRRQSAKGQQMLNAWADRNGYRLLHSKYRTFLRGPFFGNSSRYQRVYYITVADTDGSIRTGYVRCGSYFRGVLADQVDVRWDDE